MRLFTKPYSGESVGDIGTSISHLKEIEDLQVLRSIISKNDIPLLYNRKWTEVGGEYFKRLVQGEDIPVFKSVWAKDDYFTYGNYKDLKQLKIHTYSIDPIDDFRFLIEIFIEDLIADTHLMAYVGHALEILSKETIWEKDLRNGLYVSIVPGMDNVPIIVAKQDNNGDTYIASPIRLGHLEESTNVREHYGFIRS